MPESPNPEPTSSPKGRETGRPPLIHKEARTIPLPDGNTRWETRCGLTLENDLDLVHPLEDMTKALDNPPGPDQGKTPCVDCMTQEEKARIIDRLLNDPETRADTLRAMDSANPGNPYVEMALAHETNPEFRNWLNNHTFKAVQELETGKRARSQQTQGE